MPDTKRIQLVDSAPNTPRARGLSGMDGDRRGALCQRRDDCFEPGLIAGFIARQVETNDIAGAPPTRDRIAEELLILRA